GMLRDLGYTVPTDEVEASEDIELPPRTQSTPYDPTAPLPSYLLDEADAGAQQGDFATEQLDDPFGDGPLPAFPIDDLSQRYAGLAPPESEEIAAPQPARSPPSPVAFAREPSPPIPPRVPDKPAPSSPGSLLRPGLLGGLTRDPSPLREIPAPSPIRIPSPPVAIPPPSPSGGQLDEQALEEVEFFASNSMFDEARNLLEE